MRINYDFLFCAKKLTAFLCFFALLAWLTPAWADIFYWQGSDYITPSAWTLKTNWSNATTGQQGIALPGPTDHAVIHDFGASQRGMPVITTDVGEVGIVTPAWHPVTASLTIRQGGRIKVSGFLRLGNSAGAHGILNLQGGQLTTNELDIGANDGQGEVHLDGGVIQAALLSFGVATDGHSLGKLDITSGTLIVNGNLTADLASNGNITAFGGGGRLIFDYNQTNSGKTTVTASRDLATAWNPLPGDGAAVRLEKVNTLALRWSAGAGATGHEVYLGLSRSAVESATNSDATGLFRGHLASGVININPAPLAPGQTYYWRVDETGPSGVVSKGPVWKFTIDIEERDSLSDTCVASDALARPAFGQAECGAPRDGHTVGIFYFTWHGTHIPAGSQGPFDVDKIIHQHPFTDPHNPWADNPAFGAPSGQWWGEPEAGYYLADDEWVIRRNIAMLTNAGVDVLVLDASNGLTYHSAYTTLLEVLNKMQTEGFRSNLKLCFLTHAQSPQTATQLYNEFYKIDTYADYWYRWQGKPLILGVPDGLTSDNPRAAVSQPIKDFFTWRESWAWDDGQHKWQWIDTSPQNWAWDTVADRPEELPVAIASHPLGQPQAAGGAIGRSYHNGAEPDYDKFHMPIGGTEGLGLYFAEQIRRGLKVDPPFMFITGWNEWTAGVFYNTDDWDIYLLGRRVPKNGYYFVDHYNREFSRDAEPVKGGFTDNYYYQLVDGIRRFKGVRPLPPASRSKQIAIDGDFNDWADVGPEYRDTPGDTFHRNHAGFGQAGPYINTTGRNDFITLKVARDAQNIYFYAETREPISPATDPNWMVLFIDADQNHATGWEGYDYIVNLGGVGAGVTTLKRNVSGSWTWTTVDTAIPFKVAGNKLELAIPRGELGLGADPLSFDFHWADNLQQPGEITDFAVSGDSAPDRRFNYRYRALAAEEKVLRADDFEQGKNAFWDETYNTGNRWNLKTSAAFSGTHALECNVGNGQGSGVLITRIDTTGRGSLRITFKYKLHNAGDARDVWVYYNTAAGWIPIRKLSRDELYTPSQSWGYDESQDVWLTWTDVRYNSGADARFFNKDFAFHIQGEALKSTDQTIWFDDFKLTATTDRLAPDSAVRVATWTLFE